jgi:hypothetical protein
MRFKTRIRKLQEQFGNKTGLPLDIIMMPFAPLLDAEGNRVYGGKRSDSVRAKVEHGPDITFFDRLANKTLSDFEARILATHPRGRFVRVLSFIPPEPPAA